jgi:SAM-dependent methyltransferase
MMRAELELNRRHWDEATRIHTRGNVYGTDDFRAGKCRLHRVEIEEVGNVTQQRLLHLQCHFGLDTLSWARRGAQVTGVDFSPDAIAYARRLSEETRVPAAFVCSNLYELQDNLDAKGTFDIVFTSYGVLCWLPDLEPWGKLIARYLKPGGFFYIAEAHPTARMFPLDEDMPKARVFKPFFPYFHDPTGIRFPPEADYADPNARQTVDQHVWHHSLGDIVNAVTAQGLRVDFLHEFPYCAWPVVAGSELVEPFSESHGYYGRRDNPQLPLMFSLKATKPYA